MDEYARFKWVPPTCFIVGWLLLFVGPFLFPKLLNLYIQFLTYLGLARMIYLIICATIGLVKTLRLPKHMKGQYQTEYTYAWVVPTVNEEENILCGTLDQLAKHTRAKDNYVVFLAFEDVKGNKDKAELIVEKYANIFRHVDYTIHKLLPGESKGKASNVSWCVEQFESKIPKEIDLSKLLITIIDSDSIAPVEYIDHVNAHLYKNPEQANKTVFCPTMIFKLNDMDVPILTRTFDHFHCLAHYTSTVSAFDLSLPFSNYSVSYPLIKSVGFWDKGKDSVAEDNHNFSKMFWANNGDVYGVPIYTPFIQSNIQSGDNYLDNMRAKFTQATRHAMGVFEVSYNLSKFVDCKHKTAKKWAYMTFIFEGFLFHTAFSSFALLYESTRPFWVSENAAPLIRQQMMENQFYLRVLTILNVVMILIFDAYKRYSFKRFYGGVNESLWRILEYPVFMIFGIATLLIPTQVIAAFKGVSKSFEYIVAEKKIKTKDNAC